MAKKIVSSKTLADAMALFNNAPVAPASKKVTKKSKDRSEVDLGPKLDQLAALKLMEKALASMAAQFTSEIKELVTDHFVGEIIDTRKRPNSFLGVGDQAQASCELRRMTSAAKLDDATILQLEALGISTERKETIPERFILNPEVVNDQDQLRVLAEVIRDNKELSAMNLIMKQEAQFHTSVGENAIEELCATKLDEAQIKDVLEKIGTIAVGKFQFTGENDQLAAAWKIIKDQDLLGSSISDDTKKKVTA